MKRGQMNGTEQAYAKLLRDRQTAGEVDWYSFEAINLRLANDTFYKPDFFVMLSNGELEVHEVKGSPGFFTEDAKAKTKIAAEKFPFRFIVAYPRKKRDGGGWTFQEF